LALWAVSNFNSLCAKKNINKIKIKKMKKTKTLSILFGAVAAIAILLAACCKGDDCCKDGTSVTREVPVSSDILGIIIEGPWDVSVTQNITKNDATLVYPSCYENRVTATLRSNGYLHIKVRGSVSAPHNQFRATINATDLEKIEGSGATTILTTGIYKGRDISLSGASKIDGYFCEGNTTEIMLSGASTLKNFTFTGNRMNAALSGASKMIFYSEVEYCTTDCSGASKFEGYGYAAKTTFNGSGASSFKTLDLESENLDVDFSGATTGEITVNNRIKGDLSGASTLKYKRATDVTGVHLSGSSKLIRLD
jgi:hypothetical protein